MRFSIVIPAHNGEKYLRQSIESALAQERKADEIIVVDDASEDETASIAKAYTESGTLKYFHNAVSTGFVDAWNRAIQRTSGEYVSILHQDDMLHPEYLRHIERALKLFPRAEHLYTGCNYVDEAGNIIKTTAGPHSLEPVLYSGERYAHEYLNGAVNNRHIHRCPGVTTSRRILLDECTYRKEAGHIADDDFFLRVGAFTDVVGISRPLADFRHHALSATSTADSLNVTLARDYVFQSRYYRDHGALLSPEDIHKIDVHAVRFINRLLFQALLLERQDWLLDAVNLRKEFDEMKPSFMKQYLPLWARAMWYGLSHFDDKNRVVSSYVIALDTVVKLRDSFRSLISKR